MEDRAYRVLELDLRARGPVDDEVRPVVVEAVLVARQDGVEEFAVGVSSWDGMGTTGELEVCYCWMGHLLLFSSAYDISMLYWSLDIGSNLLSPEFLSSLVLR